MALTDGDDVLLAILDNVELRHGLLGAGSVESASSCSDSGEPGDASSSSDSEGSAVAPRALPPQRKRRHRRKSRAAREARDACAGAEDGEGPPLDVIESALQQGLNVSVQRARHGATAQVVVLWLEGDVLRWGERRTAAASKRNRLALGDVRDVVDGPAADELVLIGEDEAAVLTVGASSTAERDALVSGLLFLSALAKRP